MFQVPEYEFVTSVSNPDGFEKNTIYGLDKGVDQISLIYSIYLCDVHKYILVFCFFLFIKAESCMQYESSVIISRETVDCLSCIRLASQSYSPSNDSVINLPMTMMRRVEKTVNNFCFIKHRIGSSGFRIIIPSFLSNRV